MRKKYITEREKRRLLKVMIDHGIYTRTELAKKLGVSPSYIRLLLFGYQPYYTLRERIEKYFNTRIFDQYVHSNSDR